MLREETLACRHSVRSSSNDRPRPPLISLPATIISDGRTQETTVQCEARQAACPAQGRPTAAERMPPLPQPAASASGMPDLRNLCRP